MHGLRPNPASFRDPSGHVLCDDKYAYRIINKSYGSTEWDQVHPLMSEAVKSGLMLDFEEAPAAEGEWKRLISKKLPFISYPYEWSFSQLKDAALLTLKLQKLALTRDCELKDATAFNIQFAGSEPVFIDLLSFERRKENKPWQAYGQYCSHFLAPLALGAHGYMNAGRLAQLWIDGIPLDFAASLLPIKSRFKAGLLLHLHMHAKMRGKNSDPRSAKAKAEKILMSSKDVLGVVESLERLTASLRLPKKQTEWGDYYQDTNYTRTGAEFKEKTISDWASRRPGKLALDLGANEGRYTFLLTPYFETVIAADFDPLAVEKLYLKNKERKSGVIPIILDLSNPTPSLGWAGEEREAFHERVKPDFLCALALCHHLRFTAGIPLNKIADYFNKLLKAGALAAIEFVPREDSQVERMLACRDDIFEDYTLHNFINVFHDKGFKLCEQRPVPDGARNLCLFQKL